MHLIKKVSLTTQCLAICLTCAACVVDMTVDHAFNIQIINNRKQIILGTPRMTASQLAVVAPPPLTASPSLRELHGHPQPSPSHQRKPSLALRELHGHPQPSPSHQRKPSLAQNGKVKIFQVHCRRIRLDLSRMFFCD